MNKQTLKIIVFAGLFAVPFIPFLVSSSLFFPYITTKAFAWRVIVELVFAAWLLLAVLDAQYRPKRSPVLYAVLAFIAAVGLADLFAVDRGLALWSNYERMEGFISLLHLGMFYLAASSVFREEYWRQWWNTTLFASFLMVIYALLQLSGSIPINQGGVRVDGTFGNATYLAVYMLFHIFMAGLFFYREYRNKTLRWVYGFLIIFQLAILYYTATRGAILGLMGGLGIVALINLWNREDMRLRRVSQALLLLIALVVGGFYLARNTDFVMKSPVLSRFATLSIEEFNRGGRWYVWPMALEGFKERPLLGWGQENFVYVFQKHYTAKMAQLEPWFDRAHNIFLDWMVAAGLVGLLAYLSLYGAILLVIWKRSPHLSHFEKSLITGLLAAYFFHNFFVFDNLISYILFFALLAYSQREATEALWANKSVPVNLSTRIVLPAIAILILLPLYFWNAKPLIANSYLIEALRSIQNRQFEGATLYFQKAYAASGFGRMEIAEHMAANSVPILESDLAAEKKNEFYAFAKATVLAEADKRPGNARPQLLAGAFLTMTGYPDESLVYLEKARLLIPEKQQVYYDIGSAYFAKGENLKGLQTFQYAFDLDSNNIEAKVFYLLGAIYAGDARLERELRKILTEREFFLENKILSAYYSKGRTAQVIEILQARKRLDPANAAAYDEYLKQVR